MPDPEAASATRADRLIDGGLRAALRLALALPYERRVPTFGAFIARAAGPLSGFRRRALDQLALAFPDLEEAERRRIARKSLDNLGRTLIEIYSGREFADRIAAADCLTGPGLDTVLAARAARRPVVLVSAHFGNLLTTATAFAAAGHPPAMLYRPLSNPLSEVHWSAALESVSSPLFGRDRRGLGAMARHVREGGFLALAADQHVSGAPRLELFGLPARTSLSPAALALKHGGLLVPAFALRQADGIAHRVEVQAPIPAGEAEVMMQDYNDRLETIVRRHPGQWLWPHRRWKA